MEQEPRLLDRHRPPGGQERREDREPVRHTARHRDGVRCRRDSATTRQLLDDRGAQFGEPTMVGRSEVVVGGLLEHAAQGAAQARRSNVAGGTSAGWSRAT